MKRDEKYNQKLRKNDMVEFYRFIATIGIMFFHSAIVGGSGKYPFWGGYIFVEFFFLLSGYFSLKHLEGHRTEIENQTAKFAVQYTFRKLLRVIPYTVVATIAFCIVTSVQYHQTVKQIAITCLYLPFQLLYFQMFGFLPVKEAQFLPGLQMQYGPFWYLSALLLVLPIMLFVAAKWKDVFYSYLSTLGAIFMYGFILLNFGNMAGFSDYNGFIFSGVFRAAAGLFIGGLIFQVSEWLSHKELTHFSECLLTIAEIIFFFWRHYSLFIQDISMMRLLYFYLL